MSDEEYPPIISPTYEIKQLFSLSRIDGKTEMKINFFYAEISLHKIGGSYLQLLLNIINRKDYQVISLLLLTIGYPPVLSNSKKLKTKSTGVIK